MGEGRIERRWPDGRRSEYPILEATLTTGRSGAFRWLSLVASARPGDWTADGGEPEPRTVEVGVHIDEPDPVDWSGREFSLPEKNPLTRCAPAWLYYDEGYSVLSECVLSVGERTGSALRIRVVGRDAFSGCTVEVTGAFGLIEEQGANRA